MDQEALYFGENGIIKNAVDNNKVDIKRIVLSDKNHMLIKTHLNILNISIKIINTWIF